ncbi:MAG: hypothetical protein KC931_26195 [Candidatus Omnitrophica bacterium]|nr:hypothetical protein [Candidatus Omnitrophota bacterium]
MEDPTRPLRKKEAGKRRRSLSAVIPWIGSIFWGILWIWVLVASTPQEQAESKPKNRLETAEIGLNGLNIRQKTDYTDEKFTWMDLTASSGHNVEDRPGAHMLYDVRVQVVVEKRSHAQPQSEKDITGLQDDLDIAWFLIRADRGIYSFRTRNIELEGDAEVFGYSQTGELREWISADRIIYDWENGQIRSDGYAIYQGESMAINRRKPSSGVFSAGLDLTQASIRHWRHLEEGFKTPFNDPNLLPPYNPPEALLSLRENEPVPDGGVILETPGSSLVQ